MVLLLLLLMMMMKMTSTMWTDCLQSGTEG